MMNMMVPLLISDFLLILGMVITVIGILVVLTDLKNNLGDKRNY